MKYRYSTDKETLKYTYEHAKSRMDLHQEIAAKHQRIIREHPHYTSEREALEDAIKIERVNPCTCQIWAKVGKYDDTYYIMDYWIVTTDDWRIKVAAEYIGMVQVYDETTFTYIIADNVKTDDIINLGTRSSTLE